MIVKRTELSFWERLYAPAIIGGFKVTARHFVDTVFRRGSVTMEYPEQKWVVPEGYRGAPYLVKDQAGATKCVSCQLCEFVCPPKAIKITPPGPALLSSATSATSEASAAAGAGRRAIDLRCSSAFVAFFARFDSSLIDSLLSIAFFACSSVLLCSSISAVSLRTAHMCGGNRAASSEKTRSSKASAPARCAIFFTMRQRTLPALSGSFSRNVADEYWERICFFCCRRSPAAALTPGTDS